MTSHGLVLIVSSHDDWSAAEVVDALSARGAEYRWLDPADFPQRLTVAACLGESEASGWCGRITTSQGEYVDLGEIDAVFYRRPGDFVMPAGMSGPERRFARAQARVGLGGVLASLPVRWINHPSALADSEYKPRQLALAKESGLRTPRTLVTNERQSVREFAARVGEVVVKPLAEPIVAEADGHTVVWTRRVTEMDLDDLTGVERTAHLFQEWVPKAYEVRLTVVGRHMFPVAICAGSPAAHVDWRSDYDALTYTTVPCPDEIVTAVRSYLAGAGLVYAAMDFIVREDQQWIFLETNGAGQWGWLAEECGLPVAEAVAEELVGAGR